jgi:putative ABC transport system substrate-binding protein
MRRRTFITLLGGAAAEWPIAARAQQSAVPVIGFLNSQSPDGFTERLRGFHKGLKETGFVEGENVAIEYRWAENQMGRLPTLAADLVRRKVAVIAATGGRDAPLAAKSATTTIPIVFGVAEDPVRLGLVASLARPGANLTGLNFFNLELATKRLELLHELVPTSTRVALLVNPIGDGANVESTVKGVESSARSIGLQVRVLNAGSSSEIDAAFAILARERPNALFVGGGVFFTNRRVQLVHLATRHAIPATYPVRDYAEAGGLMSYGASVTDAYRQIGVYIGRILKGAKPADLPVVQASKFELVINHQSARMLGLTVPPSLLAIADEVIE